LDFTRSGRGVGVHCRKRNGIVLFYISFVWLGVVIAFIAATVIRLRAFEVFGKRAYPSGPEPPSVSVIIPARNEAEAIGSCVDGVLSQTYSPDRLEIIVVDDSSTDNTPTVVQKIAESDARVRLIPAGLKPRDWIGKNLACWQGAQAASGQWLCFIDSDTFLEPSVLSTAMRTATAKGADLFSVFPFLELQGSWERLLVPPGLIAILLAMDARKINDASHKEAAAASGAFMMIRRSAYESVGGHRTVRGKITEDIALARVFKSAGFNLFLMRGSRLIRAHMFETLRAAWQGVPRIGVDVTGGSGAVLLFSLLALLMGWVSIGLSIIAALRVADTLTPESEVWIAVAALLGLVILATANALAAHTCKIPSIYGILFPVGFTLLAIAGLNTIRLHRRGSVCWGGREYTLNRESQDWSSKG
jgi:chlorobactene glucosyltransferase